MMMFVDMHKETAGMSGEHRRALRESQRQKFASMTDSERQQFAEKLQSEWDAMPADQKESIKLQVARWRARPKNWGDTNAQSAH